MAQLLKQIFVFGNLGMLQHAKWTLPYNQVRERNVYEDLCGLIFEVNLLWSAGLEKAVSSKVLKEVKHWLVSVCTKENTISVFASSMKMPWAASA